MKNLFTLKKKGCRPSSFLLKSLFFISFFFISHYQFAGITSVKILDISTGDEVSEICPFKEYYLQLDYILLSGNNVTDIRWSVDPSGSGGFPQNNFLPSINSGQLSIGNLKKVRVAWGNQSNSSQTSLHDEGTVVGFHVFVYYEKSDGSQDLLTASRYVDLKGIKAPHISGPSNIQYCCDGTYEYSISNFGHADEYHWTLPSGWNIIAMFNNGRKILVKPDNNSGGSISCRVEMSCAPNFYHKIANRTVTRFTPTPQFKELIDVSTGKVVQKHQVCVNQTIRFELEELCEATSYSITLPETWVTTYSYNGIVEGYPIAYSSSFATGTVEFNGCPTASGSINVSTKNAAPANPIFEQFGYSNYHCGKWNYCPSGGNLSVKSDAHLTNSTETIQWEIVSGNWKFSNGLASITVNALNNAGYYEQPISSWLAYPGGGTARVRFTNCVGTSSWTYITFYQEQSEFCPGDPNYEVYPEWCSCCQPSNDGPPNEQKRDLTQSVKEFDTFKMFPNPGTDNLSIEFKKGEQYSITIYNGTGTRIYNEENGKLISNINTESFPKGVYIVILDNGLETKTMKWIKK